jgi:hypothetical protein
MRAISTCFSWFSHLFFLHSSTLITLHEHKKLQTPPYFMQLSPASPPPPAPQFLKYFQTSCLSPLLRTLQSTRRNPWLCVRACVRACGVSQSTVFCDTLLAACWMTKLENLPLSAIRKIVQTSADFRNCKNSKEIEITAFLESVLNLSMR